MTNIEILPYDILIKIGTYLDSKDIKACIETSKIFYNISYSQIRHYTRLNCYNVNDNLQNIRNNTKYILKLKPHLIEHTIFLTDITADILQLENDVKDMCTYHIIVLYFIRCSDVVIRKILSYFSLEVNVCIVLEKLSGNEDFLQHPHLRYIETSLYNDNINTILSNDNICHVPELIFINHTTYETNIDFNNIDISKNRILMLILAENSTGKCLHANKITHLIDANNSDNILFYTSLLYDNENFKTTSRMIEICMMNKVSINEPFVKYGIPNFPYNVTYKITIHDNRSLMIVNEIITQSDNKQYIQYMCQNDEEHLNAIFAIKLFPQYTQNIACNSNYNMNTIDRNELKTIEDIYNKMSLEAQEYWYSTYALYKHILNKLNQLN